MVGFLTLILPWEKKKEKKKKKKEKGESNLFLIITLFS